LNAAIEQFATKGFAAVRIDEIAAAAEANKQLIYYYFDNKAGLYEAVLEHMVGLMVPVWESWENAESLEAALDLVVSRSALTTNWRRLLAWEGVEHGTRGSQIHLEPVRTASLGHLSAVIQRAKERGEVRGDVDAQALALMLIAFGSVQVNMPQVARMITSEDPSSDHFAARQKALLRMVVSALHP